MAKVTRETQLKNQLRLAKSIIKRKEEQIKEMQLLIDQANEKLKVHFSKVIGGFEPTYNQIRQAAKDCMKLYPSYKTVKEREEHILQATSLFEIMLKNINAQK